MSKVNKTKSARGVRSGRTDTLYVYIRPENSQFLKQYKDKYTLPVSLIVDAAIKAFRTGKRPSVRELAQIGRNA
jgi:hypothetical protein